MLVAEQRGDIVAGQQFVEQVDEGNHPEHAGDPADAVDHPVTEDGADQDAGREQHDADPVFHMQ